MEKQTILDFLTRQKLMVVSTTTADTTPEAAVVGFSENNNLEIVFGTAKTTRKYTNLQTNNHVACVIGWDEEEKITVQYEGTAQELVGDEREEAMQKHFIKHPGAKKFNDNPDQTYFKILPKWIRFTNYSAFPAEIFELNF